MKNFKQYITETVPTESDVALLNEAKFSNNNMKKVAELLGSIAGKRLGGKFAYAWTDEFKKSSGESGRGLRYMSDNGQQIRFNNVFSSPNAFAINSIDYWKKGDTLTEPSLTLFFKEEVNIVRIVSQVFDSIKAGKVVPVKLKNIVNESLREGKNEERDARFDFAATHGIPKSYAWGVKKFKDAVEKRGLEAEWDEYMTIKSNDSEITKFDDELKVSQSKLDDDKFYADPEFVFDDIKHGAELIGKGLWRSMIVAGMGGVGKTFGIKQTLTSMFGPYQEGPGGKWAYYEGLKGLGMGFYITFLLNKDKIVVVDDSDSIWYKGNVNMMKIITSDSGDRAPSWNSSGTANVAMMTQEEREIYEAQYIDAVIEDPNTTMKPPSKFNFTGQFINISNMKGEEFDAAIKSRSIFIDVYLAQRDVLRRMATIMRFEGDAEEEILEVLEALDPNAADALAGTGKYSAQPKYMTPEEARKNKQLNMRSVGIARAMRRSGWPGWQRAAGLYS